MAGHFRIHINCYQHLFRKGKQYHDRQHYQRVDNSTSVEPDPAHFKVFGAISLTYLAFESAVESKTKGHTEGTYQDVTHANACHGYLVVDVADDVDGGEIGQLEADCCEDLGKGDFGDN